MKTTIISIITLLSINCFAKISDEEAATIVRQCEEICKVVKNERNHALCVIGCYVCKTTDDPKEKKDCESDEKNN